MPTRFWLGLTNDPLNANNWTKGPGGNPGVPESGDTIIVNNYWMSVWGGGTESLQGDITSLGPLKSLKIQGRSWAPAVDPVGVDSYGAPNPLIGIFLDQVTIDDRYFGWMGAANGSDQALLGTHYLDLVGNQDYGPSVDLLRFYFGKASIRGVVKNCNAVIDNFYTWQDLNVGGEVAVEKGRERLDCSLEFISTTRTGSDAANGVTDSLRVGSIQESEAGLCPPLEVMYKPTSNFHAPDTLSIEYPSKTTVRVPVLHNVTMSTNDVVVPGYSVQTPTLVLEHPNTPDVSPGHASYDEDASIKLPQSYKSLIDTLSMTGPAISVTDANKAVLLLKVGTEISYITGEKGLLKYLGGNLSNEITEGLLTGLTCHVNEPDTGIYLDVGESASCGVTVRKHSRNIDKHRDNWFAEDIVPTYSFVKVTWYDEHPTDPPTTCCR